MSLVIAWRNPLPPARAERKVRKVVEDELGTVYLVTGPDATQESFELYPSGGTKGGAAEVPAERRRKGQGAAINLDVLADLSAAASPGVLP
jgi:hypothetical protein